MFCLNCGKQIDDSSTSCPYCGSLIGNANGFSENPYGAQAAPSEGLGIAAIVVGAVGILMAWLVALLGYIFGGIGLTLALVGKHQNKLSSKATVGMILSIITLACSLLNSILGVLLVFSML